MFSEAGTAQVVALEKLYSSKAKALNKLPNTNPAWVLLGFSYKWVVTVGTRLTSEAYMESQDHSEGKLSKDSVTFSNCFFQRIISPFT